MAFLLTKITPETCPSSAVLAARWWIMMVPANSSTRTLGSSDQLVDTFCEYLICLPFERSIRMMMCVYLSLFTMYCRYSQLIPTHPNSSHFDGHIPMISHGFPLCARQEFAMALVKARGEAKAQDVLALQFLGGQTYRYR